MDVKQIFDLGIKMGIESDFRTKAQIEKQLKRVKEQYKKLPKEEQEIFDKEKMTNPYSDTRLHFVNGQKKVKRVIAGVDIDSGDLMIAKYLGDQSPKKRIDLAINHHPIGLGLAGLSDVMHLQADVLAMYGVPINVAEGLMKLRIDEVARGVNGANHFKVVDSARNIGVDLINIHTPADNLVAKFLDEKIKKDQPEYVGDIIKSILEIPEYKEAAKKGFGPTIYTGNGNSRCGKIALTELTGGTEGSPKIYEKMANAGVGTVIAMHQSEEHKKAAEKAHINVVIAGHISSDSLGMNLFLDELEKKGIEIVPCSGLIRYSRVKKK